MRIDLHTHSSASDGTEAPGEVVAAAARAGLDVVALTDHDTTQGWAEAEEAARRHGIRLVRGMELSCRAAGTSVHLLSYLHDPADAALLAQTERIRGSRRSRVRRMVELIGEDLDLTWADVQAQSEPGTTLGRPHVADALVARGHVPDRSSAFDTILAPDSPYYVGHEAPDAVTAVRLVRAAGGVPVLAHPWASARGLVVPTSVIEEMAEAGLRALEVDHRDHDRSQREGLRDLAQSLGLLVTGSSDYHGAGKPNVLGENTTAPEVFERIAAEGRMEVVPG